jgi:hypothetical protein
MNGAGAPSATLVGRIRSIAPPNLWIRAEKAIADQKTKIFDEKGETIPLETLKPGMLVSIEGKPEREGRLRAQTIRVSVKTLVVFGPDESSDAEGPPDIRLPRAPQKQISVRLHGTLIPIPHDDPIELQNLLEALFILEDWTGVEYFNRELSLIPWSLRDPKNPSLEEYLYADLRRMLRGEAPDTDEVSPIADLQQGLTIADLPLIEAARRALDNETKRLRDRTNDIFVDINQKARELITTRLVRSRVQALSEAGRYFNFTGERSARAALNAVTSFRVEATRQDVRDLRARFTRLRPAAERAAAKLKALKQAEASERRSREYIESQRSRGWPVSDDPLSNFRAKIAALRRPFEQLAAEQVKDALDFPVLHRFSAMELLRAQQADDQLLGDMVFGRLRRTWLAAGGILRDLDQPVHTADLPSIDDLAKREQKTVWWYPKMIDEALHALNADPDSLEFAVAKYILAGLDLRRGGGGLAQGVTESLVTMALTTVCPPAGFALELALAGRDIWQVSAEYGQRSAEFECALDPNDILGAEPSLLPVAFAVAGGMLSVVMRPTSPRPAP